MKRGVVIVMNPQNGEILALVSLPSYDNNVFSEGISPAEYQKLLNDPEKPLVNHAISDQYPPGSTYKLVAGTGLLADGKITASTRIRTMGYISLGGFKFRDWNGAGFGLCNIYCGFGHSSDTFFYQAAAMLGIDRHGYWGKQFGFGAPDGHRPARRGERRRPDEQVEAGHAGPADLPGRGVPRRHRPGLRGGHPAAAPERLLRARERRHALQAARRAARSSARTGPSRRSSPKSSTRSTPPRARCGSCGAPAGTWSSSATPTTWSTCRSSSPARPAPRSSAPRTTAASTRSTRGSPGTCRRIRTRRPPIPTAGRPLSAPTPSSRCSCSPTTRGTVGNAATEIAKYYFQLHFDIKKDYREPVPPQARQLLRDAVGRADEHRQRPRRSPEPLDRRSRERRLAQLRHPARDLRRAPAGVRARDGLQQHRDRRPRGLRRRLGLPARPDVDRHRGRGVPRRDRLRLPLAEDVCVAPVRRPAGPAGRHARDRRRRRRHVALGLGLRPAVPVQRAREGPDDRGARELPRQPHGAPRFDLVHRGRRDPGRPPVPARPAPAGSRDRPRVRGDPRRHAVHVRREPAMARRALRRRDRGVPVCVELRPGRLPEGAPHRRSSTRWRTSRAAATSCTRRRSRSALAAGSARA